MTGKQKKELDRRIAAYHDNPSLGSPWKEVKKFPIYRTNVEGKCSSDDLRGEGRLSSKFIIYEG